MDFESLAGWDDDDHLAAFRAFERSARALRRVKPVPAGAVGAARIDCERPRARFAGRARPTRADFFETRFRPFRIVPENGGGFLTGYYEPCVPASTVETEAFRWPILGRPD